MRGHGRLFPRGRQCRWRCAARGCGSSCPREAGGMRKAGLSLLAAVVLAAIAAPWLAPNAPDRRYAKSQYAPPSDIQLFDGGPQAPFIHPRRLVNPLERRFEEDLSRRVALRWF